ncbi:hypothetical protein ACHAXA_002267 [Cyclostephanos tholiformis]|uniref:Prokaryotic-type class I peptide chain release factors domain-containing protein n=1 Tax=Cyclostephanos tholiformis TaxID=382380 RepID=A0ABD3RTX9_9STRA
MMSLAASSFVLLSLILATAAATATTTMMTMTTSSSSSLYHHDHHRCCHRRRRRRRRHHEARLIAGGGGLSLLQGGGARDGGWWGLRMGGNNALAFSAMSSSRRRRHRRATRKMMRVPERDGIVVLGRSSSHGDDDADTRSWNRHRHHLHHRHHHHHDRGRPGRNSSRLLRRWQNQSWALCASDTPASAEDDDGRIGRSLTQPSSSHSSLSSSSSSYSIDIAALRILVRDAIDIHDRNARGGERRGGGGNSSGNSYAAAAVIRELNELRNKIDDIDRWRTLREDAMGSLEVLEELMSSSHPSHSSTSSSSPDDDDDDDDDAEMMYLAANECRDCATRLIEAMRRYELAALLSGPYDSTPTCRLLLTAGAGGTEACDWVSMLYRMYERHARHLGMSAITLDASRGDVTGYKSVEMEISGPNAYGWFRAERGAHRLVRLSPFNANSKRQTTFAGVDVVPVLDDEVLKDVNIPEGELEITTMRSGGKGGQNVNKVETGVRVKHIPSGIAVKCTQERSQSMNKQLALRRLKAQLLSIAQEQRIKDVNAIRGDVVEASWGAQIRNYVMQPYRLVKDSRSGHETSDVDGVLDGGTALEEFVEAWLRWTRDVEEREKEQMEKYGSIL